MRPPNDSIHRAHEPGHCGILVLVDLMNAFSLGGSEPRVILVCQVVGMASSGRLVAALSEALHTRRDQRQGTMSEPRFNSRREHLTTCLRKVRQRFCAFQLLGHGCCCRQPGLSRGTASHRGREVGLGPGHGRGQRSPRRAAVRCSSRNALQLYDLHSTFLSLIAPFFFLDLQRHLDHPPDCFRPRWLVRLLLSPFVDAGCECWRHT